MSILDGDIQLLKSEVLDDVPEGGGMATGIAVVDGTSNNLFPDISELDRTYGRIALRKIYPAVVTDNTDTYFGANIIVAEKPADPNVSVTLFTTGSWSDHRSDATNKLESYIAMSGESRWMLYGNHLAGQRTVQFHGAHSFVAPEVDGVLALVRRSDETIYQYVRLARLVSRAENVQFEDTKGIFYRDIVTYELSDALRYAFAAGTMERYTADWFSPPTRIHTTIAADAASYYGVQPLRIAAYLGDLTLKAQSIYTQLVPSALAEIPIVDARCSSDRTVIVPIAGAVQLSFSSILTTTAGATAVRYFGRPVGRGSVAVTVGGVTVVDDGDGALVTTSGYTGSVDYETGSVSIAHTAAMSSSATFTASPACAVAISGHTDSTVITVSNRGYTYVKTLLPVPAPGSVVVSFMAQGKWYSLYDDGAGALAGDEGTGVGTVNYATGSVVLTLGALPDADTQILFGWGSPAHFESHVGASVFDAPSIKLAIAGGALEPGALSISYLAGGVTKTVSDNGAGGFTGDGTGYVDYANGVVVIKPSLLPDSSSNLTISYKQGGSSTEVFAAGGAVNNFTLAHAVMPGTLALSFNDDKGTSYVVTDNGAGGLVLQSANTSGANFGFGTISITSSTGISGSVNYGTGAVSLAASVTVRYQYQTGYTWATTTQAAVASGSISAVYRVATDTAGATQNVGVTMPPLAIDLLPSIANALVPGGLSFTLAGNTYVDRAGSLIKNPSVTTNSGTVAGSVNYTTGIATLTDYIGGGAPAAAVACLTRRGTWTDWQVKFRTAGAPLQSASLYVSAIRADTGALISGTADGSGDIGGALVEGVVDTTVGIVSIRFGDMVTAAGNESEWWYNAADVISGQIFRPKMVLLDTAKYSAVATSSLPLSANILGLDPVRLPVDGRVPIFRPGDVVVVHHTGTTAPQAVSNGQVVNTGRVRLAKIRVVGNDGLTISAGYTPNLDAGTVLFTATAGYAQPIHIEHRIEDMALVSDVQINGELQITRPLTHDFPVGSYVSTALVIGDMHARVSVLFDQQTWTGWYDTLQGSAATGTYNKTQFPLVVTNRGAIEERWEIVFTNSTTVNVIGETVGQILTAAPITNLIAPLNPAQNVPYFSLDPLGWGQGWAAGNVLRFNTKAANYPTWCARTVLQGNPTTTNDQFTLGVRGDVDA